MNNKNIVIFVIIIVAIIAGLFLFNSVLKDDILGDGSVSEDNIDIEIKIPVASIFVPNQISGKDIFIESVFLPNGGYVVIHKEQDGKPKAVLGVSKFLSEGETSNFKVDINEKTDFEDVLFAILRSDNGDEVFNANTDTMIVDHSEQVVLTKFIIVGDGAFEGEAKL